MRGARRAVAAAALAAAGLSGCGFGAGKGVRDASLRVTDGFGARSLGELRSTRTPGADTVARFLERHHDVRTIDGGNFITAIDGRRGNGPGGAPVAWFYFVNGIQAGDGAAAHPLQEGDRVWWDRHFWGAAMDVPAVVGSFPAPLAGARRPLVSVRCAGAGGACAETLARLRAAGVRTTRGAPAGRAPRVLVGPWAALARAYGRAPRLLGGPPAGSGVFARFRAGGRRLGLLDSRGGRAATAGSGTGLVAAVIARPDPVTWLVTGTDSAGVARAAEHLTAYDLSRRFALALPARGAPAALPAR